jgi:hypothetical protein
LKTTKTQWLTCKKNISRYLLPKTINWDKGVSAISLGMSFAPPIVVHASLLTIILAWNARILRIFLVANEYAAKMPPEDFGSEDHQDVVERTVLFEHLECRGTPEALSKFSAPPMAIGDNHEWGVLISTFLLDHDPSRIIDFYQIFDGPPEGVGSKWDGASEGARLIPRTRNRIPSNRQANHSVTSGFQRKSTWSEKLCSFGATPRCNISFLATLGCFNSIVNKQSFVDTQFWCLGVHNTTPL